MRLLTKIDDLREELSCDCEFNMDKTTLKTLSETELLETYNRIDNIKILGAKQAAQGRENYSETPKFVALIADEMKVPIDKSDLSIAHRLPSRLDDKPIIARFTRRTVKIEMLCNKRSSVGSNQFQNVKIYEDVSKAWLNFLRLLMRDVRVNTAYIREGTIY